MLLHSSLLLHAGTSPAYQADYEFVKAYGALNSSVRSDYDTKSAQFWLAPGGEWVPMYAYDD